MRHRQLGVLVIALVAVLVTVVANLRPTIIQGSAQSAPVPGIPAVGDCVLDALGGSLLASANETATSRSSHYSRQQIGPCAGARYGEVVAVMRTPRAPVMAGDATSRYLEDPNMDSCYLSTPSYLGLPAGSVSTYWMPNLRRTSVMSAPTIRQQAAGQQWVACVVGLPPPNGSAGPVIGSSYNSSLRDALHTGSQRDHLGSCLESTDRELDSGTDCGLPHALETFAFGSTNGLPVSRTALQESCGQLVRRLTGLPDPTAGGQLVIDMYVGQGSAADNAEPQIPADTVLQCGVAAADNRRLSGSLIALGTQPIPWA